MDYNLILHWEHLKCLISWFFHSVVYGLEKKKVKKSDVSISKKSTVKLPCDWEELQDIHTIGHIIQPADSVCYSVPTINKWNILPETDTCEFWYLISNVNQFNCWKIMLPKQVNS